jgi:sugar transferase (PEP-CTERM/EpsH1 system associated)
VREALESLLFLTQRIPFPPDKGDKIRSWHILQHLRRTHRIFLGCFIDDPDDYRHLDRLRQVCADVACFPISPWPRRLRAVACLQPGQPLTLDYFRDDRLRSWIADTVAEHDIRRTFVFSSSMAPYAMALQGRRVLDLVDLDSAKWREYAIRRCWPLSLVFSREAHTLGTFERRAAAQFDQTLLVSDAEVADFLMSGDLASSSIAAMGNGVDLAYFSATKDFGCPFAPGVVPIVFTGAMDYWPNVDAVRWFAHEVMPKLRAAGMAARFYVVGSRPTRAVRRLSHLPFVEVTERVPDTRPYLAHAFAAVAPLKIGRGVQNKVLEAMAMGAPVIASECAGRGIGAQPDRDLIVANQPSEWVHRLLSLSASERARLRKAGRRWVEHHHVWEYNLRMLDRWLPPSIEPIGTDAGLRV